MNGTKKSDNDEVLYLNEINDEVSKPLTSVGSEAVSPVHLRAGFDADGDAVDNSRRLSLGETETNEHNKKPSAQSIGFDNGDGPEFPLAGHPPGWSGFPDPALNSIITPDVNVYQHKKTLAQGMMDLALLSANANQMRYVLQTDDKHSYFYPALVMISMSLFLQIAVGIGLIWNSIYNVKEHDEMCKANQANNWTVIGIFLITVLNVFISSFGVVDQSVAVTT